MGKLSIVCVFGISFVDVCLWKVIQAFISSARALGLYLPSKDVRYRYPWFHDDYPFLAEVCLPFCKDFLISQKVQSPPSVLDFHFLQTRNIEFQLQLFLSFNICFYLFLYFMRFRDKVFVNIRRFFFWIKIKPFCAYCF